MKTTGGSVTGNLNFDRTEVNIGSAMNVETGEFKAPFSGTYSFMVSALSAGMEKTFQIAIKKIKTRKTKHKTTQLEPTHNKYT